MSNFNKNLTSLLHYNYLKSVKKFASSNRGSLTIKNQPMLLRFYMLRE